VCKTSLRIPLLDVFMPNVLPLFTAVPRVPKIGHGDVETDTEREGSNKYGRHVDTVSLDERVVKGSGERHCGGMIRRRNCFVAGVFGVVSLRVAGAVGV